MKKWTFFSLILLLMALAGCQGDHTADNTVYDARKGKESAPKVMNREDNAGVRDFTNDRGKNDQHQVEDDITNQNPNFLDLNRTGSGSEAGGTNEGNDINQAKRAIADTNEFVPDSIWINGDRMWVTVYKKGMLSDRDKNDAEARLHRKLVQALPRYNIEVKVKEDRR
ncbi:hypothetical protein [Neobacillus dielmonensis]|uniref:hypothetical protein n=1 Tax=Neobacillus dielmonensis TaxID=1347369 RepID=UPI0005A5FD1D|nr:hypothetical protein [Neobacillus dielmonensis]